MTKRPTILDVARHAGVSKSTVSLVLQNSPLVRDQTRAQVRDAMRALNYVYNRSAAGLRGAESGLIGLVINDLRNPFFTEFAASAQMALARAGYATVIANTDEDPGLQEQVTGSMVEHGVSAVILCPCYDRDETSLAALKRSGLPVLQVLRQGDAGPGFPFLSLDYASGSESAARHLIEQGARSIAFVGGFENRPVTLERMSGYRLAMERAGLPLKVISGRPSRAFGRRVALEIAHGETDAAVCFSDLVALGMHAGFAEAGVRLGVDFRLAGFDDIEECALVWPQLSSVRCDIASFAERAAQVLLDWLNSGIAPVEMPRIPVQLIARQSTTGP
ncbi:LacI family DNA-binding transcriptional regulator [Cognatishimia sp. F0-27]|uniref:LacI family DNA-binding transcriptional regulator n=1 Tax=Cognatishimia sp. F0-27 TaxID=2816855 RepID=UPI001D0C50F0|nr:LacI family DNA-binding transcriptional regulator [Cognatishimia sp. F0-27]MCC1492920.1 LacI family DNA-binding transcriptional regulator [Cognatishimia sp. F0-27]